MEKTRICIFIHYSTTDTLPHYVQIYINELSLYFNEIRVLSNNPKLNKQDYNLNRNINFVFLENKGYDFGMFYRFITKEELNSYSQIAIVNDSNFLLKKLDKIFLWANNNYADFWGLVDSIEKPHFSTHKDNYHIQSHFIVLNQKAINLLPNFLKALDTKQIMEEKNIDKLRHRVINDWEIGLTQHFIKMGLKVDSFINTRKMLMKYRPKKVNVTFSLYNELIAYEGYPLMKKKIATMKKKWYKRGKKQWLETIKKYGNKQWNLYKIT